MQPQKTQKLNSITKDVKKEEIRSAPESGKKIEFNKKNSTQKEYLPSSPSSINTTISSSFSKLSPSEQSLLVQIGKKGRSEKSLDAQGQNQETTKKVLPPQLPTRRTKEFPKPEILKSNIQNNQNSEILKKSSKRIKSKLP